MKDPVDLHELISPQAYATYLRLFAIENGLRELILEELGAVGGSRWYKRRLSKDLIDKYELGIAFERQTRWTDLVPHHPLYYLDFPDLKKLIIQKDNWNAAFKSIFRSSEIVNGTLTELESIRNKVAHNRIISKRDAEVVAGAYDKIASSVGDTRWPQLIRRCTYAIDIADHLTALKNAMDSLKSACLRADRVDHCSSWRNTLDAWWFDESYLGAPTSGIADFFALVEKYMLLPRNRGGGHKIEEWIAKNKLSDVYRDAEAEIDELLKRRI